MLALCATDKSQQDSFTEGHALEPVQEPTPVVCQHLRVLDALLSPVLVPTGDVVLRRLERDELVTKAFFDEHGPIVLVDDGFLVLRWRPNQ